MLNRKQAPLIVDAVNFDLHLKPYDKYKLANGTDVYAINAGAEDVLEALSATVADVTQAEDAPASRT